MAIKSSVSTQSEKHESSAAPAEPARLQLALADEQPTAPPNPAVELVPLASIEKDDALICRANGISKTVARDYSEALKGGGTFPPVVLFKDAKGKLWTADGHHRIAAHQLAGRSEIAAEIRIGDRKAALVFAASANSAHGLRRTTADKRRAVGLLLAAFPKWSDRKIGEQCAVDHKTVSAARAREAGEIPQQQAGGEIPQHARTAAKLVKTLQGLITAWPATDAEGRALFAEQLRACATRLTEALSGEKAPEARPKPIKGTKGKAKATKAPKAKVAA